MNIVNTAVLRQFQILGFSEKEALVYLCLLDLGKGTAQGISKYTRISRTTIYFVLESLTVKSLVSSETKKGTKFFKPLSPSLLNKLGQQKRKEAIQQEAAARELTEALSSFYHGHAYHTPSLQIQEGLPAIITMLYDSLSEWERSMLASDNTWWGYQDDEFVADYKPFLERYWKIKKNEQKVCIFSNKSLVEKNIKVPNRFIRPLPKGFVFKSTFWICGEYIIVIMHKNKPAYAFQIKDGMLAENIKTVFRLLWFASEDW